MRSVIGHTTVTAWRLLGRAANRVALSAFNKLAGCGLLAVALVVLPGIWLVHRRRIGGPFLFIQERVGRAGQRFRIIKVRTRDGDVHLGTFTESLRKWRIDELTQSVNVLRGQMDIVGPRPLMPSDARRHSAIRLQVRPGCFDPVQFGLVTSDRDLVASCPRFWFCLRVVASAPVALVGGTYRPRTEVRLTPVGIGTGNITALVLRD